MSSFSKTTEPSLSTSCVVETRDTICRGLVIVTYPSGLQTYYIRHGKMRVRVRLGNSRNLTLQQSREMAFKAMANGRIELTFSQVAAEQSEVSELAGIGSVAKDQARFKRHIEPILGELPISQCLVWHVQKVLEHLPEKWSAATFNRLLAQLKKVFRFAVRQGYIGHSPATAFRSRREMKRSLPEVTDALVLRVSSAIRSLKEKNRMAGYLVALLFFTGMRLGEAQGLRWGDVSFVSRQITLRKTKADRLHHVPLNPASLDLLKNVKSEATNSSDDDFIFRSASTGKPISRPARLWRAACDSQGLPDTFCIHSLRHMFASLCVREGVALYTVQGLLGHSTIRMTERYASMASEDLLVASSRVAFAMGASVGGGL